MGNSLVLTVLTIIATVLLIVAAIMWEAIYHPDGHGFGYASFSCIALVLFLSILSWLADFGVASMPIDQNLGFLNSGFWRGLCFLLMGFWYFPAYAYVHKDAVAPYALFRCSVEAGGVKISNDHCINATVDGVIGFVSEILSLVVMIIGAVQGGVC